MWEFEEGGRVINYVFAEEISCEGVKNVRLIEFFFNFLRGYLFGGIRDGDVLDWDKNIVFN